LEIVLSGEKIPAFKRMSSMFISLCPNRDSINDKGLTAFRHHILEFGLEATC